MGVSSLRCWGICKLLLKWNLNQKEYIFWLRPNVLNTQFIFGLFWYGFMPFSFLFFKENVQLHYIIHIFLFCTFWKKKNKAFFLCLNCKIICLGIGPGFCSLIKLSFLAIVIIRCTITPRRCVQGQRRLPSSLCVWRALSCIKIGNGLQQVVYTRACMQAHMKTLTQTLTVTKRNTRTATYISVAWNLEKICLAGVENCCFDIKKKKNLSYFFVIQML